VVDHADGIMLVLSSGQQLYRQYLLEGAARHRPLWLIDVREPTWQRPFIVGSTVVGMLDSGRSVPDQEMLERAALAVAGTHRIAGVLTYDEAFVTAAAHVAQRLGVPGLTPEAADRCRDKHLTRLALTAAGLPQPRFVLARCVEDAVAAADDIGYPVVLKPRGMGASIGVVRADTRADLVRGFRLADAAGHTGPPSYESGVLVEQLVIGPEISIDGVTTADGYHPFCLAHKRVGLAPYFEETGHVVDAGDPLLSDERLLGLLDRAHRTLGIRDGITHTEIRLSAEGPVIIEVNARLGGDLIPYLGWLAGGIDPGRVAADVAAGAPPRLEPARRTCAGIRFLYPTQDCRVLDVTVPAPGALDGLVEARAMVPPGAEVLLPPRAHIGRYAYVICAADSPAACDTRLDDAEKLSYLRYDGIGQVR
jgi:biotin carboxylase